MGKLCSGAWAGALNWNTRTGQLAFLAGISGKKGEKEKNRTYTGVYDPAEDCFVQLADTRMPHIRIPKSNHILLGSSSVPYAKLLTWDGHYRDYYLADPESGEKKLVLEALQERPSLSPDGKFLSW